MKRKNRTPFPCKLFGELVRRKGFSISDSELSKLSGIPRTTIHHLCTNADANPRWSTIHDLFGTLGYTITIAPSKWPSRKEVAS